MLNKILDVPWNAAAWVLGKFLDWNYRNWNASR